MSLMINHNITALNSWRNLSSTDRSMGKAMEKLSSGLRINRAADDPAGLVISEKMRSQLSGLAAGAKNVEKAINMVGTAEAAMDKVNSLLNKMRTLAVDSANLGVNDTAMLSANQDELDQAIDSIGRIADFTQFGTIKLLNGSLDGTGTGTSATFQVGANESQTVSVDIKSVKASALATSTATTVKYTAANGSKYDVKFSSLKALRSGGALANGVFAHDATARGSVANTGTLDGAVAAGQPTESVADDISQAIAIIDQAVGEVSTTRGQLGAFQADNLEVSLDALNVSYENLQAAESTIRDTDMTKEMANFTKLQIMMQAGTAMLAQANQLPNNVLQLLK